MGQRKQASRRKPEMPRISDLDVVDFLEIFGSTTRCSEFLGISQSSCSRRYRLLSDEFQLGIGRFEGDYRPAANGDILDSMRDTAQKIRLRRGQFRYAISWSCGDLAHDLDRCFPGALAIPMATMSSHELLNLVDLRLLDLVICGLMELQDLLPVPCLELDSRSFALTARVHALPLCRWELQLMADRQHPLARPGDRDVEPRDLLAYPSPALPLGTAPRLMQQLNQRGLGTRRYRLPHHDLRHWEAAAADGHSLSYAAPHQLERLENEFGLVPLLHSLGILETLALIGQAETLRATSPIVPELRAALQAKPQAHADGMTWLTAAEAPALAAGRP